MIDTIHPPSSYDQDISVEIKPLLKALSNDDSEDIHFEQPIPVESSDSESSDLNLIESPNSQIQKKKCKIHNNKRLEAFCETCKILVCIECILDSKHKNHEMSAMDKAQKSQLA